MKKKTYIQPQISLVNIEMHSFLCQSLEVNPGAENAGKQYAKKYQGNSISNSWYDQNVF